MLADINTIIKPIVDEYDGNVLKEIGDGLLIEFGSSVSAVKCGINIQDGIKEYNLNNNSIKDILIRIGIHLGDVIVQNGDVMGDGVNVASRVEPLADPGGLCITQAVYQSVAGSIKLDAQKMGEVELKNIFDKYVLYKFPKTLNTSHY